MERNLRRNQDPVYIIEALGLERVVLIGLRVRTS